MSENQESVRPKTFRQGTSHAKDRLRAASEGIITSNNALVPVPQDVFSYLFGLQVQIEQEGAMDYHKYADKMWKELAGDRISQDQGFRQFEGLMISGLHNIDMSELVYPHLLENMDHLVERYKDDIESVAIWSTGDVSATGYQAGKIDRSRIIKQFFGTLRESLGGDRSEFVKNKTAYLVDDDKYDRLAEYAGQRLNEDPEKMAKIVIIEDSAGSFEKAQKILDERLGVGKAEVVPVWFTASREGTNAQKVVDELKGTEKYEEEKEKLENKKKDLNAISNFEELLDDSRFGKIFKDSHVMVDFDGVVCDNIKMRDEQAKVIYSALVNGISQSTGKELEESERMIMENLAKVE